MTPPLTLATHRRQRAARDASAAELALLDRCARLEAGVAALRDELRAELPDLHPMARVLAVEVVKRISGRLDGLLAEGGS